MTTLTSMFTKRLDMNDSVPDWDICKEFIMRHGTWAAYLSSMLVIVGLLANALLLYTVFRSVILRGASSNSFIVSITLGNILLLLISAPAFIKQEFNVCWELGVGACKFYAFSEVFAVSAISFSILAINYERFRVARGKKAIDSKSRGIMLACIWVAAFVLAIPTASFADLAYENFCHVRPHFEPQGKAYIIIQFLCAYLFASIINIILRVAALIFRSAEVETNSDVPHHTPKQLNMATAFITLTVIVAWLPFYVFSIGLEFQSLPFDNHDLITNLYDAQYVLLFFNAAQCPFILWAFSGMHREAVLQEVFGDVQCCGKCSQTGDRYATFQNEFDLGDDNTTDLPRARIVLRDDDDDIDGDANHI